MHKSIDVRKHMNGLDMIIPVGTGTNIVIGTLSIRLTTLFKPEVVELKACIISFGISCNVRITRKSESTYYVFMKLYEFIVT